MLAYKNEEREMKEAVVYSFKEEWKRRKKIKRRNTIYYLKQRLSGGILVGLSMAAPALLERDATISILLLPLGIYLLFTKEKVMAFKER